MWLLKATKTFKISDQTIIPTQNHDSPNLIFIKYQLSKYFYINQHDHCIQLPAKLWPLNNDCRSYSIQIFANLIFIQNLEYELKIDLKSIPWQLSFSVLIFSVSLSLSLSFAPFQIVFSFNQVVIVFSEFNLNSISQIVKVKILESIKGLD